MPKVGAHVSAAVSLETSFEKAKNIGAQCTQIFISPPRKWGFTENGKEEILRYKDIKSKTGIRKNFIHGTYLINLGTPNPEHFEKSIEWLKYALSYADKLGIEGVIFHLGSHKGVGYHQILPQVTEALKKILNETSSHMSSGNVDGGPLLILETTAGAGNVIGDKFSEMGEILKQVQDDRLKVCMDTQHAFAAGYDLKTAEGIDKTLEEFDKEIGLSNLAAIHANDSKTELNSHIDRHANIGEGFIGIDGFKNLINHPKLKDISFILEVPGFSGNGPDEENVKILNSLKD